MTNEDTKKIIESTFDEVAQKYDSNLYFTLTAKNIANSFNSKKDFLLLDVSTGTGIVAFEIIKQHPNINIEAVDISQGMLDIAKKKAKDLNINNILFKQNDVEKLNYNHHTFDIITCGFGLFFYPNMQETFNNLCDMIKKEGKFIFSSFSKDAFNPYSDIFLDSLETNYKISFPKRTKGLLNTKEEIVQLVTNKHNYKYEIKEIEIAYKITINQWWELLNSAGYKSLLNRLNEEELKTFKINHLKEIENLSQDTKIILKVNTLVTTLFL